jgi:hypothetical protein
VVDFSHVTSFGGIDADVDALLDECFENHEAYQAAKARKHFLLVGRKGSGKTAIFRMFIKAREPTLFSFGHTFSDYPWHHHNKQKAIGVPEEECFLHSWEYLIYITLAKILLNQDNSQPYDEHCLENLSKIEKFVIDTYGSRDPDISSIFSPAKQIKLGAHFMVNVGVASVGANPSIISMDHLPTVIQDINKNMMNAIMKCINPDNNYYICFDELDLGFSTTDPDYTLRLTGLLLASRKINNKARELNIPMSILIFLRDDIYQNLHFEDKNKLTESAVSRIEWDTRRTTHTLKGLMERRFSKVFGIPPENAWNAVFNESREMPGHQTKYQHIIDRTFFRPRDIIKFCNEILVAHKARVATKQSPEGGRFDNEDVSAARSTYSDYFLRELEDEVPKHLPAYKAYFELLKSLDSLQFTLEDFDKACKDRALILPRESTAVGILGQLFDFSIVGYYRPGGGGGGAEYVWRYEDPRALFDEHAASYRVHAGLKEVLGLKKFTRSG